ncbi:MAG: hypothetical protein B9S32_05510 [Verrucomicrobia bacterium Tous-C9LFEB]|nr:MAG: hypothetical protein B9S32_05510 [Verrucomicrobia bacterium Tous-C9LFEB]
MRGGKWIRVFKLAGILSLAWVSSALAQMGPVENRIEEGKGDGPKIEMRIRLFEMTREQVQEFVAKHAPNPGLVPVVVLDQALKTPNAGILGMLGQESMEALWKAVEATPKLDVVVSPSVRAASGAKASLRIGRSFRYPTTFTPKAGEPGVSTPGDYETRPLGLSFEATPTLTADGKAIDLKLRYELGSLVAYRKLSDRIESAVDGSTDYEAMNRIAQPLFNVRRADLSCFVRLGKTLWIQLAPGNVETKGVKPPEFVFLLVQASVVEAK